MWGVISFFVCILILGSTGCIGGEQAPTPTKAIDTPAPTAYTPPLIDTEEAKSLFEIKCSLCHSLNRPASKKKSYDGWLSTVHRMIGHGAPLTDEDAEIIAAYLAQEQGLE